jgi:hypothetical protein
MALGAGVLVVAAAAARAPSAPAAPPDPPGAVDAIDAALRDPALPFEQRLDLMERAIRARGVLIDGADADDDRVPTWLVEQAALRLDRLTIEGTDAAVLLGIPTARQRERAQAEAWEAFRAVVRADQGAARAVRRLQASVLDGAPGEGVEGARARAQAVEAALARLIDVEQAVRIPFYRGRAAALLAALETGESGRAAREEHGRVAMESLGGLRVAGGAAEAVRRVTLAAVLLTLWPRAEKPAADAAALARGVAGAEGGADGPSPMARAMAQMALVLAARDAVALRAAVADLASASRREPFVVQGRTDPLLALLAAEAVARAMLEEQPGDGAARAAWLDEAFAPLLALLTREDLHADRAALRPVVLAKVSAACEMAGPGLPLERMDARLTFARGLAALQESGGRAAGSALLEQVVAREDAGELRASALWELAVARSQGAGAENAAEAAAYLCRLARDFPESPRADEAALKAVELCRYAAGLAARDPATPPELTRRIADLYGRALEASYTRRAPDAQTPSLRIERARLILDAAGRDLTPDLLDRALEALEGVRGATPEQARQAEGLGAAAVEAAIDSARAAIAGSGGGPVARERLVAVARRAVQWAQVCRPAAADGYRVLLADALLDAGDPRALPILEDLAGRRPPPSGVDAERLRLNLGRAQRLAGRPGDAFATLRVLVEEADVRVVAGGWGDAASSTVRSPVYWEAWAEMLEILAADNAGGQRSGTLRTQIARLRVLDPALGNARSRSRIEAVARAVGE